MPTLTARTVQDLGAAIRARRRALHLDQRTLAEQVGVSRQWIIDAEKGKPRAEAALLLRTLNALGLRLLVDDGEGAPRPAIDLGDVLAAQGRRAAP